MRSDKVEITEIDFFPIKPHKGLVCFVSFTFNNQIRINDVALITRPQGGYRLSYPLRQLKNGKSVQSAYPINTITGKAIEESILQGYANYLSKFGIKENI